MASQDHKELNSYSLILDWYLEGLGAVTITVTRFWAASTVLEESCPTRVGTRAQMPSSRRERKGTENAAKFPPLHRVCARLDVSQ